MRDTQARPIADSDRRERVRKACGMKAKPSPETWTDALDVVTKIQADS